MQANDIVGTDLAADLDLLREAAAEGARIALGYFRKTPDVWMKEGASPVSEADIAVDRFLRETLCKARPDYGWLSEETADNPDRLSARRTFVVDPIDGTRAFIDGKRTWCVSVAVVEDGEPLTGVLDCPARQEVYLAVKDGKATRNGETISVRAPAHPPRIGGPRALLNLAPTDMDGGEKVPYVPSLAYRIAMVAAGELDATFVKPNSHDWDLAAADLVLACAGGKVLDPSGRRPRYAGPQPRHGALAAGSGTLLERMVPVIAAYEA